jgi:hypothetical protein
MALEGAGGTGGSSVNPQTIEAYYAPPPPSSPEEQPVDDSTFTNGGESTLPANVQRSFLLARNEPQFTTSGANTEATYQTGDPKRPNIRHDNGFLQNPNNPSDPNPISPRSPSWDDRLAYAKQLAKADAALAAVELGVPKWATPDQFDKYLDLPDGIRAYHHFLTGNGADSSFSYDKFVRDDPAGKTILNNAIGDTQRGAEDIYRQMVANDPSLANKTVTFKMTGSQIGVGGSNSAYPYPQTENWQKAIGAHSIWNSATVTVRPASEPGGKPTFEMKFTLHGEDRYNFNPGATDIATGQPDSDNGRFEATGLAHQYMNYGSLTRDVTWTGGSSNNTTRISGEPR